ncbi:MAG: tRNA (adenosine(37)-N6)-threonylcarbamoyltransferase complex ATPase subunit type 1 TsaE [Candidatus Margulisbacteria bacterium]|nr:tRNA (adenosine(37)-N6)-threonylcarbamoyltransferase complex ATPase subunit type 1 TsaE [Candidatus Margulisiibacteriota bacterium]
MFTIKTSSSKETKKIASNLAKILPAPFVLALNGNLGTGKTTFVQGFCQALKVKEVVNSPSFTLVNNYTGTTPVQHIDFYRLNTETEIELLGIDEYLPPQKGFTLIEWASHAPHLISKPYLELNFNDLGNDTREISFSLEGPAKNLLGNIQKGLK